MHGFGKAYLSEYSGTIFLLQSDPGKKKLHPYSMDGQECTKSMEHEIVRRVAAAQKDAQDADALVRQYLPFIKAETAKFLKRMISTTMTIRMTDPAASADTSTFTDAS